MACSLGQRSKNYKVDVTEPIEHTTNWRSIYIVALVAFIGSVHTHCIQPAIWPYMRLIIPDVTETFYGFMNSIQSIGIVISALIAGFVSNKLKNTTQPMLFAKIMAIISCFIYMAIELVDVDSKRAFFVLFQLMLGISVGAANIYRTHVAMASTEHDRPKAVGICSLAPAIGIFVGPLGQILFTALGYPGLTFLFGTHINLYTAPILMTIAISIVGAFLLMFCFDGRMRVYKDETPLKVISDGESSSNSLNSLGSSKYDVVAVLVCLYTKMLVNLCLLNFTAIGVPYSMLAFEWTSEQSVLYISVCMFLVGLNICFWNLAYIFLDLRKRLSERKAIIGAIFFLLIAYLLTYPWPFIQGTIPYQTNSTSEIGCKIEFTWCATTPRVNMWMFLGSLITVLGLAIPLAQINLDILFSKVLGNNVKQGTLQGLMIVSGEALSIVGPIVLTQVYTSSGPTYIWQFEIGVILISIVLWLVFYKRMIGKSKRLAGK